MSNKAKSATVEQPKNRRIRATRYGFSVQEQLLGKLGHREYGCLLDRLQRIAAPKRRRTRAAA